MILTLSKIGGLFALLSFVHFFVDWIFQSHNEAMAKHSNAVIRAKHCLIYSSAFLIVFWLLHLSLVATLLLFFILFLSHFVEDTYYPVYLWAKYIRRPDCMKDDSISGFMVFMNTPLGKILMIAIDQIVHLFFVLIVSILIVLEPWQ